MESDEFDEEVLEEFAEHHVAQFWSAHRQEPPLAWVNDDCFLTFFGIPFYYTRQERMIIPEMEMDSERVMLCNEGEYYWIMDIVPTKMAMHYIAMKKNMYTEMGINPNSIIETGKRLSDYGWYRFCDFIIKHALLKTLNRKPLTRANTFLKLFAPANQQGTAIYEMSVRKNLNDHSLNYEEPTVTAREWPDMAHLSVAVETIKLEKGVKRVMDAMYLRAPFILMVRAPFDKNRVDDMGKLNDNLYAIKPYTDGPPAIGNAYYHAEIEFYLRMVSFNFKNSLAQESNGVPDTIGYHLFAWPDKKDRTLVGVQKTLHPGTPNEKKVMRTMYQGILTSVEYLRGVGNTYKELSIGLVNRIVLIDRSLFFRA